MKERITDQEILERFEYYTMQVKELLVQGEDFNNVVDQIPFGVHLNDSKTLEVMHVNDKLTEVIGPFLQYVLLPGDKEVSPLITFTKSTKHEDGLVICLSLIPEECGKNSAKVEQVVEMDQFKLKHFKKFQQLTEREVEILKLLANGCNNPEIAEQLYLARSTVETHHKNLNRKLELRSFRDLMKYAFAFNLVEI